MKYFIAALLSIAAALGLLAWRQYLSPPLFAASTTVQPTHDEIDLPELKSRDSKSLDLTYFSQTEAEIIASETVLGPVIQQLELNTRWGARFSDGQKLKTSETLAILRQRLQVQVAPNTTSLEIQVCGETAAEAVEIANACVLAYKDYRTNHRRTLAETAIKALAADYQSMEAKVLTASNAMVTARSHLTDSPGATPTAEIAAEAETRSRGLYKQFSEASLRCLALSNQLISARALPQSSPEFLVTLSNRLAQAEATAMDLDKVAKDSLQQFSARKNYEEARQKYLDLNQVFAAKMQKPMAELERQRSSAGSFVEVLSPAELVAKNNERRPLSAKFLLAGSGLACLTAVAAFFLNQQWATKK